MQNGDIKNFRLSNQCSAGNGMLLQAMADQFGVPVTDYADVAFEAELSPKFSYGCAVFLDSDRVNFQKEGYSKEELLAGLAQVLPKNVWQYVVQIPRMAELGTQVRAPGRHAAQPGRAQGAGRLHQGARARRRGATSTRTPARPARSAPRWRRCAWSSAAGTRPSSASTRRSTSSTRRSNDESTRCHFCPNNCARTFIDTKTPDGAHRALHLRLLLREGHGRVGRGDARAHQGAQEADEGVPEPGRLRVEAGLPALLRSGADARGGADRSTTSRSRRRFFGVEEDGDRAHRSSARRPRRGRRARAMRIGIPKVLNIWSLGAVLAHLPRDARHPEAERRLLRRHLGGDVARGRQVRLDRSLLPVEGRAGAHPQPALPSPQRREEARTTSSSPASRTCRRGSTR